LGIDNEMSKNICVMCNGVYDTKDITYEQRIIADEDFCPVCWHREITAFADEMDFSYLKGLAS